ncbi:yip1-related [Schistosoma mansoni]|uniref:Protein YIPF n=2 Tax=Schistosoma TaxID=6181 RepID=G4VEH8_SCHMA|nr:yip1-related [Schistosoma mansoni]|eukprot:XP_018650948.1 yip1-related [Schistosoma mansoni]
MGSVLLEGHISDNGQYTGDSLTLLDEPIRDTIFRSARAVGQKFAYVLVPRQGQGLLKEWDLWGPLVLCLIMSALLHSSSNSESFGHGGPEFAQVFVIFWLGSAVVTLNSKLLGGAVSFLQTVCVLGYCILPLVIGLVICRLLLLASSNSVFVFIIRLFIVISGLVYSSYASFIFVHPTLPKNRVALSVYPIVLFYVFLSWLVISVS